MTTMTVRPLAIASTRNAAAWNAATGSPRWRNRTQASTATASVTTVVSVSSTVSSDGATMLARSPGTTTPAAVPSARAITAAIRAPSREIERGNMDAREDGARLPIGVLLPVARVVARVPNHGPATRVGHGLRPGPEHPGVERLVRSQCDVGRTYSDACHSACDLWPLLVRRSRWRCRNAPARHRRHVAPGCRLAGRRRPNVPGQSPARYNMCPLLLDRAT